MLRTLTGLIALVSCLQAAPVLLTFDVNLLFAVDAATMAPPPGFVPHHMTATLVFDPVEQSRTNSSGIKQIWFGGPAIQTPLTVTLPWIPGQQLGATIDMTYVAEVGEGANRRVGLGFSEQLQVEVGQSRTYGYSVGLNPPERPAFTDYDAFGTPDLLGWLEELRSSATPFNFTEQTYMSDRNSPAVRAGQFYGGSAVLTSIQAIPEPGTGAVVVTALLCLAAFSRKRASKPL